MNISLQQNKTSKTTILLSATSEMFKFTSALLLVIFFLTIHSASALTCDGTNGFSRNGTCPLSYTMCPHAPGNVNIPNTLSISCFTFQDFCPCPGVSNPFYGLSIDAEYGKTRFNDSYQYFTSNEVVITGDLYHINTNAATIQYSPVRPNGKIFKGTDYIGILIDDVEGCTRNHVDLVPRWYPTTVRIEVKDKYC